MPIGWPPFPACYFFTCAEQTMMVNIAKGKVGEDGDEWKWYVYANPDDKRFRGPIMLCSELSIVGFACALHINTYTRVDKLILRCTIVTDAMRLLNTVPGCSIIS